MPPVKSKKLARTKGKRSKTVKFNLGVKALIRALESAHTTAERSVAVGASKVAASRKSGNRAVAKSNNANLIAAKSARAGFRKALKALDGIDCPDQWMNCDPEYS